MTIRKRFLPQPLKIIDNFFEAPSLWRHYGLKQEYDKDLSQYPGLRSKPIDELNVSLFHQLASKLIIHATNSSSFDRLKAQFSLTTKDSSTENIIHRDEPFYNVAGLIYLNENPPKDTGTYFFGQGPTGEYKKTIVVENVYNRMVIFDPSIWHCPAGYFGDDLSTGRLTITFFGIAR